MTRQQVYDLIRRQDFEDIVRHLHPIELLIAILRLDGLTDAQIAALLHVSRPAVTKRMRRAQRRIARDLPDVAHLLAGRVRRRGRPATHPPAPPRQPKRREEP
jgi:DNA-directed RNA polymerase specialized sigma24 family protein